MIFLREYFNLLIALAVLLLCSCEAKTQKQTSVVPKQETTDASFEFIDPASLGEHISTIEFKLKAKGKDKKIFEDGFIPWISIEKPEDEIKDLIDADKPVLSYKKVVLLIDYPVKSPIEIEIQSSGEKFTRKELILKISAEYHRIYKEEEESATVKTMPMDQRPIANRNETNGKYGIWGHDLGDLDLSSVEVYKKTDGKIVLYLNVES